MLSFFLTIFGHFGRNVFSVHFCRIITTTLRLVLFFESYLLPINYLVFTLSS